MRKQWKAAAKQQIKGNIGTLFLITIILGILAAVASGLTFGIGTIIFPAIGVSICAIYLNLTKGIPAAVGDMFCRMDTFGKALWLQILTAFFTFLWSLLFVIPGIIKAYSYSMAQYVLAEHPEKTAREALNESKRIMEGHKMELFVLHLSFFWWHLLGAITFGIAYIYVTPYMSCTVANFYNAIKAPSHRAIPDSVSHHAGPQTVEPPQIGAPRNCEPPRPTVSCPKCGRANDASSLFCSCGFCLKPPAEWRDRCPNCGTTNSPDGATCRLCGKPLKRALPTAAARPASAAPSSAKPSYQPRTKTCPHCGYTQREATYCMNCGKKM